MRLSVCNEVLSPMTLAEQCAFARAVGYDGLEIAPFTLADDPTALTDGDVSRMRGIVEDHGLVVTSLHWLAMAPKGLSVTALDAPRVERTRNALLAIVDLAAGLGARTLVHGSPAQRRLDVDPERQRAMAVDHFRALGERAAQYGLTYCLEAINQRECNFLNRVEQVEAVIAEAAAPGLGVMVDVSHAAQEEPETVAALAGRLAREGRLDHLQVNAINRRGPGEGDDPADRDAIWPVMAALSEAGYAGDVAVEPFVYEPDGRATAARAAGYMRGILAASAVRAARNQGEN